MRINVFKAGGHSGQGGFVSNGLTLQGPLILSGPHSEPLHAVPKQYVDNLAYNLNANNITSGILPPGRLPAFTGDATTILGTSNITLSNTGVLPGSIVKPTVDAKGRVISSGTLLPSDISAIGFNKITVNKPTTLSGYGIMDGVKLNTDNTIQGNLILHANATDPNHAVTKQQVDSAAGQAGGISVGDIIRKPYKTTPAGFLKCNGGEVDKETYANLYSVIGDTFANDFTSGSGKPWQQQYQFNTAQSGDILGWTTGTALPSVLSYNQVLVTKNRVYILGGYNNSVSVSAIYSATINTDGSLGTWSLYGNLPAVVHGHSLFTAKNKVYVVGGANNGTYSSAIYMATINSDGTLTSWTTTTSLPSTLGYSTIIVTKNRVYTIGGHNGSSIISTIYTAAINDDGTLGTWSVHGTYPFAHYYSFVTVIKNRLYVIGGYTTTARQDVYYAEIGNDGVIGSWNSSLFLPKGLSHGTTFTTKNTVYVVANGEVYYSGINTDGSLAGWQKPIILPSYLSATSAAIVNNRVYLLGGTNQSTGVTTVLTANFSGGMNDYSSFYGEASNSSYIVAGSGKPWQQQYQINNTQTADITGWTTSSSVLPAILGLSSLIATKNRVYLLGGYTASPVATVYTAPINADGSLGTWTTSASMPGVLCYSQAIVTKNRVYVFGGSTNGTNMVGTVYTAPINSDGTLGTWATDSSLPTAFAYSQAVVTKNRVHLIGGNNGTTHTGTVYTASILSDGTLGTWTTGNSLPGPLVAAQAIVTKNRVYVCGGSNGVYTNTVYTAPINADGTLGTWSTSSSLPGILGWSQAFVTNNRAYLLGGTTNGSNTVSTVYTAPINADGTLGTWVTGTSLPASIYMTQVIATKDKIYLVGGHSGANVISTIYTANINSNITDYSPYYDGSNDINDTNINYMTPGSGRPWNLQYQINTTQTSNITGWTTGASLPGALGLSSIVVTKNRVYVCGGYTNGASVTISNVVYTAPINADGTLGTWTTGTSLPISIAAATSIVTNNRVYIFGGTSNGTNALNTIYSAPINADGTLGSWALNSATLPVGLSSTCAILIRDKIYLLAGWNGSAYVSTVYVATLSNNGSFGTWTTSNSLPWVVANHQAIVTKNRIYIFTGFNGSASYNQIATATVNSDGTIGTWSIAPVTLPVAMSHTQVFVANNVVYILGGFSTSASIAVVYRASIADDGVIGAWTSGTSLPYIVNGHSAFVAKNRIHIVGGRNDAGGTTVHWFNNTCSAAINSDIQDYSPYYDGTIQPVSTVSTKFRLPDYTIADAEFGDLLTSYIKF